MNLFYLDKDLDKCAEYHIDKHVQKMQLEITQMLCTTLWVDEVLGYIPRKVTADETATIKSACLDSGHTTETRYKPAHINHPCTIWMRESFENWEYSVLLVDALNREAMYRGYNSHKSCALALRLSAPNSLPSYGFITPALAMPDEYKSEDAIESYRNYYRAEKASIATWKRREPPEWWFKRSSKNYQDAKGLRDRCMNDSNKEIWQKQMDDIIQMQGSSDVPWRT